MPAPKKQQSGLNSGLGKAIINRRAKQQAKEYQDELHRTDLPSGLHSVTQENDLNEFLNTAQLANTDFTAERNKTITLIASSSNSNPFLLSEQEHGQLKAKQSRTKHALRVPRRPEWTPGVDKEVFENNERASFLEWRRSLADLTEQQNFLLTPFERNLAVWRQLWRTIERSQLIVQIVDARNPLNFRCEDLESYVTEVPVDASSGRGKGARRNLLLINKADLLTRKQRRIWATYLKKNSISFAFFSALDATTLQEKLDKQEELPPKDEEEALEEDQESDDESTKVLTVEALEALFISSAPPLIDFATDSQAAPTKLTIGLVGYPNVGKSSTINALIGAKKVSVSSTPGKTKNFQTIHLSDQIILCDCPGLVFPQFASTQADLVLDGVLPIDQMREWTAPVDLLCARIPKDVLEATYGLTIPVKPIEEGGSGKVTARSFLSVYAVARGYFTAGQGNPDESRAARPILKDYVNGKLLFAHAPPEEGVDSFNSENRDLVRLKKLERIKEKRAPSTRVGKGATTFIKTVQDSPSNSSSVQSSALDDAFFSNLAASHLPRFKGVQAGPGSARVQIAPHQKQLGNDAMPLKEVQDMQIGGKKHFKSNKRSKQRSGYGFD